MAWKEYLVENANVAKEYVKDYLGGSDYRSYADIPRGSGAVMREGLTKVAIYRDTKGDYHRYTAACPHMGCIVHWNGAENTWDCPCHGSRFDRFGKLINGPANVPLEPKE
jgi:Rieske Fe-S protein